MSKKPKIIDQQVIVETKIFTIEAIDLHFSNGNKQRFERLRGKRGNAVMIVPVKDDKTLLLIREYGVGLGDYYLGFPKGTLEVGEDLLVGANRELKEEIGYGAKHFEVLKQLSGSPSYTAGQMALVLAKDLYPEKLKGDEPEEIEVVSWPLREYDALVAREDFCEARSVAALYLIRDKFYGQ